MAEPQMPPGVTPLPPGVVSLEDAISGQAGLTVQPRRPVVSQAYEDYVASPLTKLVGELAAQSPIGDVGAMIGGPEGRQAAGAGTGRLLIPQNTTEMGIAAATLGAGPIAAKLATPTARAATRVGAAMLGGAAGKAIGEGDLSLGTLAKGGGQGAVAGLTGEAIGAGVNFLRKVGMERSAAKMSKIDAAEVSTAIRQNPKLKGVFNDVPPTPEGIENLVNGYVRDPKTGRAVSVGEAKLGAFMDQADAKIGSLIQQRAQQGVKIQFPLLDEPAGISGPWEVAREQLTKFGSAVKRMHPNKEYTVAGETVTGAKAKQLYAESLRAFQQQLSRVHPDAVTTFNDARGAYEAGMALIGDKTGLLPKAFGKKVHTRTAFNADVLQGALARNRKDWVNRLGEEGYWSLAKALRLDPATIGRKDVMSPTGKAAALAGVLPLPGAAYARFQLGSPGFVGPSPLAISPGQQAGLNFGASQGIGAGLDLVSPMAQQYGPLMLPGSQP